MNSFIITQRITKNNKGNALLMTLFILSGILVVTLGASSLVMSGLQKSRVQVQSTKAYFAAEAGAERALWLVRQGSFNYDGCPPSGECVVDFLLDPVSCNIGNCSQDKSVTLGNNASYNVKYASTTTEIIFTSVGEYLDTNRSIEVTYDR